jgi:TP901 family phage tail tape measure protein
MTAGFTEAGAAGERMATQVAGSLQGVSAEVTRVAEQNAMLGTSAEAAAGTWAAACAEMTASAGEAGAAMAAIQAEIEAAVAAELGLAEATAAAGAGIAAGAEAAAGTWVDASGRMRDANGRFVAANSEAATSAEAFAAKSTTAAEETAAAYGLMRDKVVGDLAAMEAAEARAAEANALVGTTMAGTAASMGTLSVAAGTFKASFADSAAVVGLTSGQFAMMGLAAAAAGGIAVKMAGDYDQATMRLVTSANESRQNLDMVRQGMLEMAGQVGYSADELATAMYKVESGGQHGADGLKVLKAAAEGAKTENADLTTVADAVTTALIDYHLKADDAATVTSKMVQATASGKMTFEELSGSLSSVAPLASAAHISLDDMLGTLASMTSHGISAQQATQNMADAIRHLQSPTAGMRQEMATLGIDASDVAAKLGERGLAGTMQMLQQAISKSMPPGSEKVFLDLKNAVSQSTPAVQGLAQKVMDGSISMAAFTKQAKELDPISAKQATSFATLAGQTHQLGQAHMSGEQVMQTYGQAMQKAMGDATGLKVALMTTGENADYTNDAIKNISGATSEAGGHVKGWAEIQSEFNTKLSQAKDGLGALAISIGEKLLPVASKIVGVFADATKWMTEHQTVAIIVAGIIGVVLVAAFVALGIAAAQAAIGVIAATWPILAIIAAVALLAFGIYELIQHWQGVADFFSGLWDKVKSAFTTAVNWCGDRISDLVGFVKSIPEKIGQGLSSLGGMIQRALANVWDWLTTPFRKGAELVKTIMSKSPGEWGHIIGEKLGELARTLVDKAKEMWHGFTTGVTNAWNETVAWFKALPGRIKDFFVGAGNWIADKAKELWHGFTTGVTNAWNETVAWFKALPGKIKDFFVDAKNWLVDKAKELWDNFTTGLKLEWEVTVQWFKDLPGKIKAFFTEAPQWLYEHGKNILTGLWKGFTDWVSNIWNGITDFIKGFIDGFKSGFGIQSPSTVFSEIGGYIIEGLWNGLKNMWNSFWGWASGLPQTVINLFSGAANWLVSAGHDLLVGLWNGITSMTSWVWDKLTGWASSLWGGVKSALGIASPSTIAHESGMWLMKGLANGIDDHADLAVTAAQSVADRVVSATQSTNRNLQALGQTAAALGTDGAAMPVTVRPGALQAASPAVLPGLSQGATNVTVVHLNPTVQGNVWTTKDLVTELQQELVRHGIRNTQNGTNYTGFGLG